MLTVSSDANIAKSMTGEGWLSIADLARARGVSGEAITQELKRLGRRGALVETKPGQGRKVMVNVRDYERCRGEAVSLAHVAIQDTKVAKETVRVRKHANCGLSAGPPAYEIEPGSPIETYTAAQARNAACAADLKKHALDLALGRTIETAAVVMACQAAGATMAGLVGRLHMRAEELLAAGDRGRLVGMRTALRTVERDLMAKIAEEFAKMAAAAIGK